MNFVNQPIQKFFIIVPILFLTLFLNEESEAGCGECEGDHADDIVHVAEHAGQFKTLLTAAKAASLVDTLESEGPFTLFAPTDAAFKKLPEGTLDALINDPAKLKEILLYHVVPGKVMAADVTKLNKATTANKKTLIVSVKEGKVYIDKSEVKGADVKASNGVIHIIDSVLIPAQNIVEAASKSNQFKTLLTAVKAASLVDTLKSEGPFTLFAPTDAAFKKLPEGTLDALINDPAKLKEILLYHVVPGKVMAADVTKLNKATTANKKTLIVSVKEGKVYIDKSKVVSADLEAGNGIIHVIDTVLIPN